MNMGKISGAKVTASWFNPPTGTTQSIGTFDNAGVKEFTCPSEGFGSDWVLVPDDASRNFGAPGSSVARRSPSLAESGSAFRAVSRALFIV